MQPPLAPVLAPGDIDLTGLPDLTLQYLQQGDIQLPTRAERENKLTPDEEVYTALATDAAHRYVGVKGDIIRINGRWLRGFWNIPPGPPGNPPLPVLQGQTLPIILARSAVHPSRFLAEIKHTPITQLLPPGFVIAGGWVGNQLMKWPGYQEAKDMDVLIVGLSEGSAKQSLARLI